MSQEKNNQEKDLSNLQAQYQSLQEKLTQQEIVNNDLIHEMLNRGISAFRRHNVEIILTYVLLAATVCWSWYRLDLSLLFMIVSVLLLLSMGLFEWFSCHKVVKINTEDSDVQTLVRKMELARVQFSLLWISGIFVLCLWMIWLISEVGSKLAITDLRSSFIMIAITLTISIILIICNIARLANMSDELLSQTSRFKAAPATTCPSYRRSGAYWVGIVMLALSLVGLVFKLMHWPFANLIFMLVAPVGIVFVLLTARYLVRVVPEERLVVRIAEVASLFLVVGVVFRMMHFPFGGLLVLVGLSLLVVSSIIWLVRRGRKGNA